MLKPGKLILLLLFFFFLTGVEPATGQATFVPNKGQWEGSFLYKTRLNGGDLFFENSGYTVNLREPGASAHSHHILATSEHNKSVAYKMQWVNASPSIQAEGGEKLSYYHNYFLGKDPSHWQSHISVYQRLHYHEVYPGISVNYFDNNDQLEYDIHIAAGANASLIKMRYMGLQSLQLEDGRLKMETGLGQITEWIPEAYQMINGVKTAVSCSYKIKDNEVGFVLGQYDHSLPLVIDPIIDFSTFTGSTADNFGFTATYDHNGNFYGGGIVLSSGYPVTVGVYQNSYGGSFCDVSITKFSDDGSQALYATYLGGADAEMPHSMVVDDQNNLLILGNTGSADFPVATNAYQDTFTSGAAVGNDFFNFSNGSNIFIAKVSEDGSQLLASTYLSGEGTDGFNKEIFHNYGDNARGEIITLPGGKVAIASSSFSRNLPFLLPVSATDSSQKAIVAVFNSTLSQLVWGSYFSGNGNETGYSVKTDGNSLFLTGATTSSDLPATGGAQASFSGKTDGYIAKFRLTDGLLQNTTYLGSSEIDESFFIDIDKFGAVYTFGQTRGTMPISSGLYSNANSYQFLQKYNNNLSQVIWSTVVGSGSSKSDLVPTAFMVDRCLNIYLSGWNGFDNRVSISSSKQGDTYGLPTTSNAFQTQTDGSDFYFMVLDRNATSLLYGSYFGGSSSEHVDGGTSRFSPDGVIYQAVCAACDGSFPTTPNAYAPTKPQPRVGSSCNLGAVKIDFEQTVRSRPLIDFKMDVDTVCDQLTVKFTNKSYHGNKYLWDLGNGQTSTAFEPSTVYNGLGTYTITLIATDTICDISDTATITLDNNTPKKPHASMEALYKGCDENFKAIFKNTSPQLNVFHWDFGDGSSSVAPNPIHNYASQGNYTVVLIASKSGCPISDTVSTIVSFQDTTSIPQVELSYMECSDDGIDIERYNDRSRYEYKWSLNGESFKGPDPDFRISSAGFYHFELTITDTLCNHSYDRSFDVDIKSLEKPTFIPNAFTPNGDGINEDLIISGKACGGGNFLKIFNRWGEIVFQTSHPFEEFWNGYVDGHPAKEDVYTYILKRGKTYSRGSISLFR